MLTTLNQLIGLPVIWQGREVGQVERGVTDAQARVLLGVMIRRGLGVAKWVPSQGIGLIGHSSIVASRKPESRPAHLPDRMRRVYLTNGSLLGEVTDQVLHTERLQVVALEISEGPLYRLMGERHYAVEYHVKQLAQQAGEVVAAQLLSWAEMNRMLEEESV